MARELLEKVLAAHGGLARWSCFATAQATIVTGGQLFGLKGTPQDPTPRRMTVATQREWASVFPYGADDQRTDFTPNRIAIEKLDGTVVKERLHPSEHAEGKAADARWDVLDRAYFNGYALWTYLTTPFHFAMPGFAVEEIEPWREDDELWRGLRARYPPTFAPAQYVFDSVTVQGITLPIKRRAYIRDERLLPIYDRLMASIDLSDISFS